MIGMSMRKLIIVCDEKTEEYGNFLRQLVSMNDDKEDEIVGTEDGTVDAVVWTEKQYRDNSANISSREHVLFIGENKVSKKEIATMPVRFNQFGMKYGWLGKRGMMVVEDGKDSPKEYEQFVAFCQRYQENIGMLQSDRSNRMALPKSKGVLIASAIVDPLGLTGASVAGVGLLLGAKKKQKETHDQKYRALTVFLYMDALSDFLEG